MTYGYRVENGRYMIHEEEAAKIRKLVKSYMAGNSIAAAGKMAGIEKSATAIRHILSNPVYTGTKAYPQILTKRTYNRVQRILLQRTHKATKQVMPVVPVQTEFHYIEQITPASGGAIEAAEAIYRSIEAIQ